MAKQWHYQTAQYVVVTNPDLLKIRSKKTIKQIMY